MSRLKITLTRQINEEEQALRDTLSWNIKKFRGRKAWSQFVLASKIDISTNFLADIEAGNTWVSSLTLVKLAKAFDIEVFELFKPKPLSSSNEESAVKPLVDRFSNDLIIALHTSLEKAVEQVKKGYLT
jgi:ribosome-binding protein aMBF1 (putative translation factor)